jgi:hypothetical protein
LMTVHSIYLPVIVSVQNTLSPLYPPTITLRMISDLKGLLCLCKTSGQQQNTDSFVCCQARSQQRLGYASPNHKRKENISKISTTRYRLFTCRCD